MRKLEPGEGKRNAKRMLWGTAQLQPPPPFSAKALISPPVACIGDGQCIAQPLCRNGLMLKRATMPKVLYPPQGTGQCRGIKPLPLHHSLRQLWRATLASELPVRAFLVPASQFNFFLHPVLLSSPCAGIDSKNAPQEFSCPQSSVSHCFPGKVACDTSPRSQVNSMESGQELISSDSWPFCHTWLTSHTDSS